jgi:hypothetical protein
VLEDEGVLKPKNLERFRPVRSSGAPWRRSTTRAFLCIYPNRVRNWRSNAEEENTCLTSITCGSETCRGEGANALDREDFVVGVGVGVGVGL